MTVQPHDQSSQELAQMPEIDPDLNVGLEEFDVEDMVTPRLSIKHRQGKFEDSLTKQVFSPLNCIILGLVKQRILWPAQKNDGDVPMCRSNDHKTGYPLMQIQGKPQNKQFPWSTAGFDVNQQVVNEEGQLELPCEGCSLKEWDSHPLGGKPWCNEQFTLAILYDPTNDGSYVPAIVTFSKTSLKPLRAYISSFARNKRPMFTTTTQITLDLVGQGDNVYSIPRFIMGGQTNPDDWRGYAANSRQMQDFLRTKPAARTEEDQPQQNSQQNAWPGNQQSAPQQNPYEQASAPAQQAPAPPAQPAQAPAAAPQQPAASHPAPTSPEPTQAAAAPQADQSLADPWSQQTAQQPQQEWPQEAPQQEAPQSEQQGPPSEQPSAANDPLPF